MDTLKHTYGNIRSREILSHKKLPDGTYVELSNADKKAYVAANMTRVMKVFMQWIDKAELGRSTDPGKFKSLTWVKDLTTMGWPLVKYYKEYYEQFQKNMRDDGEDPIAYTPVIQQVDVEKFITNPDLLQKERAKELMDEQIETSKWATRMVDDISDSEKYQKFCGYAFLRDDQC